MIQNLAGRSSVATPVQRPISSQFGTPGVDPVSAPDLILWLDAGDSSTLHGSPLDQWDDKSTYGQNYTATGTARPSTGTRTINGVNVVDFDALNDEMGSTWVADPGSSVVTAWLVAIIDTNLANHVLWMNESTGGNEAFIQARTGAVIRLAAGSGSPLDSAGGKFTTGVAFIAKFVWKQVSGALIRTTGTTDTTGATGNWANTNPGHRMWLAANSGAGGSDPIDAGIGELIVYNAAKDATISAAIDSYLETKWGLSA